MAKTKIQISSMLDLMGRIAERTTGFLLWLGNIETKLVQSNLVDKIEKPVYISGFARSGTTILLEMLEAHPDIACHKYKDFPFIDIPIIWNWFYDMAAKKQYTAIERAHMDRIMVTPQSPEAMEEILWMQFFPGCHDPRQNNVLTSDTKNPEFEYFYRDHIRKILQVRGGKRYLSKGNYNISRLDYILKLHPDAKFIIPFREPITHIASLMKQHALFCAEESRDKRILNHMKRMGHYEFGLNRCPINFGNERETYEIGQMWNAGDEVRGWARYWALLYGYVVRLLLNEPNLKEAALLINYETLCESPAETLEKMYFHCQLNIEEDQLMLLASRIASPDYYSISFSKEEKEIIQEETRDVMNMLLSLT